MFFTLNFFNSFFPFSLSKAPWEIPKLIIKKKHKDADKKLFKI